MAEGLFSPVTMHAVQLYYPAADRIVHLTMQVAPGTTIKNLLELPDVREAIAGDDLTACRVGIWNKLRTLDTVLSNLDRVEIYRPLLADPKEARRRRAENK